MNNNPLFTCKDLSLSTLHHFDRYIKKSIWNTKRDYFRNKNRAINHGIIFVDFEKIADELTYDDDAEIEDIFYFKEGGELIPIYNPALYHALNLLTRSQRIVLIENLICKIPLKDVAKELGTCLRVAQRHKHNAVDVIKRGMKDYGQNG